MRDRNSDQLLAATNPIPDPTQLEDEPFSIEDVVDLIEPMGEALVPVATTWLRLGRPMAVAAAAFVLVVAVVATGAVLTRGDDTVVSAGGLACGDTATGAGEFRDSFGSSSYNPFIGIQQSLVSQSSEPVFLVQVTGPVPANELYFRLATLESFNGEQFYASLPNLQSLDVQPWIDPCHAWSGLTFAGTVDVVIERLRMDWLPSPVSPVALSGNQDLVENTRVRFADGALRLDGALTYTGMAYSVDVEIPQLDIGALIVDADGALTPLFAAAAIAGEALPTSRPSALTRAGPRDRDHHVTLVGFGESELDHLRALAESVTSGAGSAFERGLQLEAWFHSDSFRYSTTVDPGFNGASIVSWLLDPESPEYHVGYAEQFSSSFAVLARTLDIPSRVVLGFAPGESADNETTVVRDRGAHAWVELWIPQHGWMRFDPTPRPAGDTLPTHQALVRQLGFDLAPYLTR